MLCTSKQLGILRKGITGAVLFSFLLSSVIPPQALYAQNIPTVLNLPIPGTMITPSPGYNPVIVKGINLYPENPLQFDFLVDKGGTDLDNEQLKIESQRLIKYFLASLTTPEEEMWVNLSPYEKDRIIPKGFGETEMGRDLLAQDYILKQLTSSLMYPEDELGTEFWDRVYKKANEKFGATEIPVDTFNKVWIVAEKAVVFEKGTSAFILETHLKVMLEEDYVAAQHSGQWSVFSGQKKDSEPLNTELSTDHRALTTQIIRQIIIPEIEKEVNEGKNFSSLRQIYNSLILATWFKNKLKKAAEKGYAPFLGMVYADQNKTRGIDVDDKQINQKIYSQYLEAFKKGVYDYVKEDFDPVSQQIIPRKYFSGGAVMTKSADGMMLSEMINDQALLVNNKLKENFSEEADGASWFSVVNNPILKDSAMIGKISEWLASSLASAESYKSNMPSGQKPVISKRGDKISISGINGSREELPQRFAQGYDRNGKPIIKKRDNAMAAQETEALLASGIFFKKENQWSRNELLMLIAGTPGLEYVMSNSSILKNKNNIFYEIQPLEDDKESFTWENVSEDISNKLNDDKYFMDLKRNYIFIRYAKDRSLNKFVVLRGKDTSVLQHLRKEVSLEKLYENDTPSNFKSWYTILRVFRYFLEMDESQREIELEKISGDLINTVGYYSVQNDIKTLEFEKVLKSFGYFFRSGNKLSSAVKLLIEIGRGRGLNFKDMENLHLFLLGRNKILTSEEMLLLSQGLTGKNIIIPPLLSGEILKLLDKTTFEDAFSAYGEAYTGEVKKGYNWVLFKDQTTFNHFAVTSPAYSLFNLLLDIAEKDNLEVTNQFVEILKTAAKDNAMQSEELKKYPWLSDIEYSNTKNNNFDADKMTWIFDVLENFSVNLEEKQRILVVGTSSNIKHLELIAKQSPLAQIIGIEWSPQQADKLRNLIKESKELKDKEITIHTQDARNLKGIIEDNSIDVVIYSGVFDLYLESFIGDYQSRSGYQSVKRMLEETRRVLAKGGIVIGDYTKDAKEILSNLNGMEDLRFSSRGFVIFEKKDQAMGTSNDFTKGGIDLNPQMFDLKVKGEGDDFLLPVTSKELKGINIEGFTPVIINITPATNLPMLLGLEGLGAEEPLGKIASTS